METSTELEDKLQCGICLKQLEDPRNLPCLHTFCCECLQRWLTECGGQPRLLECPICRAKHKLEGRAGMLPADQYAVQELPSIKLLQQREESSSTIDTSQKCKLCDKQAPLVGWCDACDATICESCAALHKQIVPWRGHNVYTMEEAEKNSRTYLEKRINCPKHASVEQKYFCKDCVELICSECVVEDHECHQYSKVNDARRGLEKKMKEFATLAAKRQEEFSEYLEKLQKAEKKAQECSEIIEAKVNSLFDGFVASVEAQRNLALQNTSQGVKKVWSQKELAEVILAQLKSFTRFTDRTHKCTTDARYVAMAAQGIKAMKQLKDTHPDETSLEHKNENIWLGISEVISLDSLLRLGKPSLKFIPSSGTISIDTVFETRIDVVAMVEDLPIISEQLRESCELDVKYTYIGTNEELTPRVEQARGRELSWIITLDKQDIIKRQYPKVIIRCALTGDLTIETEEVTYKMCASK